MPKSRQEKREEYEKAQAEVGDVVVEYAVPPTVNQEETEVEDHTAALAEFERALESMWPIAGTLVGVQCPLEGYRWLKVWFRINNERRVADLFRMLPPIDGVVFRIFPQFVRALEIVPQEDAVPTPDEVAAVTALDVLQPATFARLFDEAEDLLMWMRREGYTTAVTQPIKKPSAS